MDTRVIGKPASAVTPRLRSFEDLPGPRSLPFVGNLLQIESSRVHQQAEAWCAQYGSIFKLKLASRRVVVVGDHELIAAALRDRPDGFRRTTRFEEIWTEMGLASGVFGANGDVWRRQRRMVMTGFDPAHVRNYYFSMQQVAQRLVGRWQLAARGKHIINLQADLMRFTVDTIAGLAFGEEVNTLESDEDVIQNHLNRLFPILFQRIFSPLPIWRIWPSAQDRALRRSVLAINAAVDGFVEKARARLRADPELRVHPRNLLDAMLVAADEPNSGIDDPQVAGNVLTMLLAGEDTTANTLAWLIYELWRHPAAFERAIEEVRRVCPATSPPSLEQISQLDYLEACIHETMRLRPVGPINSVQALRETTLGDVRIEPGMVVMGLMRRDATSEAHIPRAAAFEPERWLADGSAAQAASATKRISMPFGAGPRICPGRYLALLEMKVAMTALFANFDILSVDTPDGKEPQELLQLAMGPVGLTMRVAARTRATAH